jgi:AP endonuclease 2
MRLVTWNVNGIRAVASGSKGRGGFRELLQSTNADILCIQETKLTRAELTEDVAVLDGWESFFDFSQQKTGYSGVATFCKAGCSPCCAARGLIGPSSDHVAHLGAAEQQALDAEGRCVMTDHGAFVLFNVYIPALSCEESREVCPFL